MADHPDFGDTLRPTAAILIRGLESLLAHAGEADREPYARLCTLIIEQAVAALGAADMPVTARSVLKTQLASLGDPEALAIAAQKLARPQLTLVGKERPQ